MADTDSGALTDRWLELNRSWPTDGWIGAAEARSRHHRNVLAVEEQLKEQHATAGHGPIQVFGIGSRRCICGAADNGILMIHDRRTIDRYGRIRGTHNDGREA